MSTEDQGERKEEEVTVETGGEEGKVEEKSDALSTEESIILSSTSLIATPRTLIPPTPIGIPTVVIIGQKIVDDDSDIMSSDSYIKQIPTIKAGITAAEFAVKEVALKSVLAIRNCSEFYSEHKHASLPTTKAGGTTDIQKDAVKRHLVALSILTIACQNNVTIMSYVEESKDEVKWPNGQMHIVITEINERYKESGLGTSNQGARLEQKKLLQDLSMKRNEDPNNLFESLAAIKLLYAGTRIPLKDEEMKDILFEKLPPVYTQTLNTCEDLWSLKYPGENFTYRILQKEILKAYKVSHKNVETGAQSKEVILFTNTGNNNGGRGNDRGGRQGRGQWQGRGRNGRGRSTQGRGNTSAKWRCHYCGSDQHLKRNCHAYKNERGELWCEHCSTAGHDDGMCFKLHPDRIRVEGGS